MSSAPVTRSLSVGAPTCVSDIAQSQIIDRVYLNSWPSKVLQNCYFVMKLIFESLLFKKPYFLYVFGRAAFPEDAVLHC